MKHFSIFIIFFFQFIQTASAEQDIAVADISQQKVEYIEEEMIDPQVLDSAVFRYQNNEATDEDLKILEKENLIKHLDELKDYDFENNESNFINQENTLDSKNANKKETRTSISKPSSDKTIYSYIYTSFFVSFINFLFIVFLLVKRK